MQQQTWWHSEGRGLWHPWRQRGGAAFLYEFLAPVAPPVQRGGECSRADGERGGSASAV